MQLIERDLKTLWHPCSQMKDYETFAPLPVVRAQGSYLYLQEGRRLIDAISSWWCKSLGHGHPRLHEALIRQMNQFDHVILANTTNNTIVDLSERLCALSPNLNKVSYASDGSCAVEIAMKLSLHYRYVSGQSGRHKFMALSNGYHGETMMTMSVSDLGLYKHPYEASLTPVDFINEVPYVSGPDDPNWQHCHSWPAIEAQLAPVADQLTAIVFEPIVQGAGGMSIYSPALLSHLRDWSRQHGVHLIADEIMTGIGRTGRALACEHAGIEADFVCLSKGLTSGCLPLSAVLCTDDVYAACYDDYETGKAFMHSHTHTGNALAAAVALETLAVIEEEQLYSRVTHKMPLWRSMMQDIAQRTGRLDNVRALGAVIAADLNVDAFSNPHPRLGYQVYQRAVELGALLRPLGNTIYWLPPLNIGDEQMQALAQITEQALLSV